LDRAIVDSRGNRTRICPPGCAGDRATGFEKNKVKPWQVESWCQSEINDVFLGRMKAVLKLYEQPHDPHHPLVCLDERSVQLLQDSRPELPTQRGKARRRDYEYVRGGTRNVFMIVTPKMGLRTILITLRRTKEDFAKCIRYLVNVIHPHAECIHIILDNLNTHHANTLIEIFGMPEAGRLLDRLHFHSTPLHASWLNLAESELSALTRQCLDRRIGSEWILAYEIVAWERRRNLDAIPIRWSFTWKRAKRLFAKMAHSLTVFTRQN
jgi:hypothetical protein